MDEEEQDLLNKLENEEEENSDSESGSEEGSEDGSSSNNGSEEEEENEEKEVAKDDDIDGQGKLDKFENQPVLSNIDNTPAEKSHPDTNLVTPLSSQSPKRTTRNKKRARIEMEAKALVDGSEKEYRAKVFAMDIDTLPDILVDPPLDL